MAKGLALAAALACLATFARGADLPSPPDAPYGGLAPFQPVEELRLGIFGDDAVHRERQAPMASLDVLSSPIVFYQTANPLLASFFAPRLEGGVMANTYGLTSYAYAGLNWRTPKWGPVFAELGFGGAVNDSSTHPHDMQHTDLGCPVTFRESAGIGWQLTERVDVLLSIEHISHANLCSNTNPGLTSAGIRVGYHF